LRIHNGAISSMGGSGTNVYAQTLDLSQLASEFNGGDGIGWSGNATTISQCRSFWNTGDGFHSLSAANITGCVAELNTGDGFEIGPGRISNCTVISGSGRGIVTSGPCQIADCSIAAALDGIAIGSNCVVERNRVTSSSTHFAIHATSSGNKIDGNDVASSLVGIQVDASSGNIVVRNTAHGNTTAFTVPASNFTGPVVTSAAGVAAASPWANFSY
jgi:parallel beta-helix repeat protein